MNDIFWYNSGSLLQALNPSETLVDLSGEPFIANIAGVVPAHRVPGRRHLRRAHRALPWAAASSTTRRSTRTSASPCPRRGRSSTANNEAIKAAGIAPVGATFGADTWTSQLFVLADYYNVQAAIPDFAEQYTSNQIKYATTPAALAGFQHLQEGFEKGWYQKDFGAATFDDGLNMLAAGEIAHYPMLTFALSTIAANHPEAITGHRLLRRSPVMTRPRTARRSGCRRRPTSPKTSKNIDEAKDFLGFIASVEGTDVLTAAVAADGPVRHQGRDAARRRAAGRQGHPGVHRRRQERTRRSSSCRPSRAPRWSRSPSRSAPACAPPRTARRSTTRTSRSRPSSSASRAGDAPGSGSKLTRGRSRPAPGPICAVRGCAGRDCVPPRCRRPSSAATPTGSTCPRRSSSASSSSCRRCWPSASA